MFCVECREYDHDYEDGQTIRGAHIVLHGVDNLWNEERFRRNRRSIVRNVYRAHKVRDSRKWEAEQWAGVAKVFGRTIRVWAWVYKGCMPKYRWSDVRGK